MPTTNNLPIPDSIAQQHSEHLLTHIKQAISKAGGKISFADYMQLCLYAPGLGYYSAGSHKLGGKGDFTTSPEISSLFSRTLAQHIIDVFQQIESKDILEFGAGSGKMAIDILLELESHNSLPEHYYIIEVSADFQQRQRQAIRLSIPHLIDKVIWLESLPTDFIGVVLANEVCDAMPVHCLHFNNGTVKERYIENVDNRLQWCESELSQVDLIRHAEEITPLITNRDDYFTEVNLAAESWLASLASTLQQGAIFIIDYGYSKTGYYHPERNSGTLMCYYQHQGHDNPLILQGLPDITAHIAFTALAQVAFDNSLQVAGFQSQADFLLAGGITELNTTETDAFDTLKTATEIKQLTLPSEMGENFKVLSLTKDLEQILAKVQLGDRRHSL